MQMQVPAIGMDLGQVLYIIHMCFVLEAKVALMSVLYYIKMMRFGTVTTTMMLELDVPVVRID